MTVGTAFFPREQDLNVKMAWGEWAGYYSAAVYADFHDIEYNAIREAVGVIDASPLFKYIVSGPDAEALLNRVLTRDVTRLPVGRVYYSPWCNERGKVMDDGTIARVGKDRFRVTSADPCYRWLKLCGAGLDFTIDDVSEEIGALALQGPKSRDLLEIVTGEDWSDLKYFGQRTTTINGVKLDVTRTGYTGDLGYELWIPADGALAVWDALFDKGQDFAIRPVGIRALDVARVEAGLILIEVEYISAAHAHNQEQEYSPFELGLGGFVDFNKDDFVGKAALQREQAEGGPKRRLVGIQIDWLGIESAFAGHGLAPEVSPMVVRDQIPLYKGGRQIGYATSTTWSPIAKKMVALATVDKEFERVGTAMQIEWTVEGQRGKVNAEVVPMPFLDLPRKRA
jgi:aminomethyltransferase